MSAFLKFRDCDVISVTYRAKPSYFLSMSIHASSRTGSSENFYIFSGSHLDGDTIYQSFDGVASTASAVISGTVQYTESPSDAEKSSLLRLRAMYAQEQFQKPLNYSTSSIWGTFTVASLASFGIVNIPQALYGSRIEPGSFTMDMDSGSTAVHITDDGLGGMITGAVLVGSIFYEHGIVAFGSKFADLHVDHTNITASFSGNNDIPMNMYLCKVPKGKMNFSNNPSYTQNTSSNNRGVITTVNPKTFITAVGLYDEDYKLVGIAKVATPVLNEESNGMVFKLKLNF